MADILANCEAQLKANAKPKEFARILKSKAASGWTGRRKWAVAAALLLPIFALTLTEIAGVAHWLRTHQATRDPLPKVSRALEQGSLPQSQRPTPNPLNYRDPEYTNTLGMKFKLIPAGKFTMGSPKEEIDRCVKLVGDEWERDRLPTEGPQHEVEITQPFYMGTTEVTVGQFRQFVDDESYRVGDDRWRTPGAQMDNHPVVFVSWQNAVDFCNWLSERDGKKYRLPTEAEWEYGCRAGKSETRYCYGDDDAQLENYGWYTKNSNGGTLAVGTKQPNVWGLYDMHGNAWEWCQDFYDPNYYKNGPVKDPLGGAGGERVVRGGSWDNAPVDCRSAFRNHTFPEIHSHNNGLRVLLVSPPSPPLTVTDPAG